MDQKDDWSFRRSKWFEAIKKECQNVKDNVGLLDMTAFAKCRIKGPESRRIFRLFSSKQTYLKKLEELDYVMRLTLKVVFTQSLQS